jgi:glucan-binding YG repeat protein
MKFDGTGDWLTALDSPQLQLGTGNFTIEGWFYLSLNNNAYGIVSKGAASTGWSVNVTSGNRIQFSYTAANLTGSTTTLAQGSWYYFAVVRSGTATGNLKIYLNGNLEVTSGGAVNDNFNQTDILYVGASRTGTTALNGYLQDIRITKAARPITASPAAPFPIQ